MTAPAQPQTSTAVTPSMVEMVGDMFSSDAPAIGHGVNTFGLMGAGVAKLMRSRYRKAMFNDYADACRSGELQAGMTRMWSGDAGMPLLANIASQDLPGPNARIEWLDSAVRYALAAVEDAGLDRLAIPQIGCGIGGLDWAEVRPVLNAAAASSTVTLEVWTLGR